MPNPGVHPRVSSVLLEGKASRYAGSLHNEDGHSVTRFDSAGGFQGYKRRLHEGGIRLAFIARWKGVIAPGQVPDHLGYSPELRNTFCEPSGTETGDQGDGVSLAPLLSGRAGLQQRHDLTSRALHKLLVREAISPGSRSDFLPEYLQKSPEPSRNLRSAKDVDTLI